MMACWHTQAIMLFEDEASWKSARAVVNNALTERMTSLGLAQGQEQPEMSLLAAKQLCERANAEFRAYRDAAAVKLYSRAIDGVRGALSAECSIADVIPAAADTAGESDERLEMMLRLLSNRAAALTRQEKWLGALADAETALALAGPSRVAAAEASAETSAHASCRPAPTAIDSMLVKCQYRVALALLLLQRPGEAIKAAASLGSSVIFKALIADAEVMLAEQQEGRYNLLEMETEAKKVAADPQVASPRLSQQRHGDYESPSMRLEALGGKGRGFVAASRIPEGTLVMASRAFVIVRIGEMEMPHAVRDGSVDRGSQALALPRVVRTLIDHPDRAPELYTLNGGPGFEADSGETKRVDVPRIMSILSNK